MQPQFTSQRIVSIYYLKLWFCTVNVVISNNDHAQFHWKQKLLLYNMCSCNCTFVPINICIASKHPVWLVCFSWTDGSGELRCHLSTVLCIQLGSLYHEERERDYNGKIKSLIPKHFLGFSGQFWWNTLFCCSYKLSKYSRKTIFQYPSYISWLSSISRIEKLFFFFFFGSCVQLFGSETMAAGWWV